MKKITYKDTIYHPGYRRTGNLHLRLNREVKNEFQVVCSRYNWTMTRAIVYFMRELIRDKRSSELEISRSGAADCSLILRGINYNIRDSFKSWCSLRGYTMVEVIDSYMKEAIKEGKPCRHL